MGNIQNSSIVNQILPMESYLLDVPELRFLKSLGTTRFMKTGLAENKDGLTAFKLFVYDNQLMSIDNYIELIKHLRRRSKELSNILPFVKVNTRERFVILHRPYRMFTLYERLSTRPFLLNIEKLWIAFQLIKVLGQLRMAILTHGDIKSHNIVLSSTNWLELTDFAPFKPAFVPYDNPSAFTYFFDTSRRRTCYLAPERFKRAEDLSYSNKSISDIANISEGLTHEMDIFAMGCVLVELLTDGRYVAFNLSQAIDYTRLDEHVTRDYLENLLSVCPPDFADVLRTMLDRDPEKRRKGFEEMAPCSSDTFPELFESYLYNYFKELSQIKDPDQIIVRLFVEYPNYKENMENDKSSCVVLLIGMVTSNMRACKALSTKMDAVHLLKRMCKLATADVITDRIIPYLVNCLNDNYSQVRGEALYIITDVLEDLNDIPQDESRLLVDYIFPRMKQLTEDSSDYVKMALASCLGRLSMISLKFFDESLSKLTQEAKLMSDQDRESQEEAVDTFARTERVALQEAVSRIFVNLSDSSNTVKQCLFDKVNLNFLCSFFGCSKSVDADVLMHMIALLNDKYDWQLRAAFFKSCYTVAKHSDPLQNSTLVPFIQQGLKDTEEFVIYETLHSLYSLCNDSKLEKPVIVEIMKEVCPFLVHPNKWLRTQVINLLSVLDASFTLADMYCKLMPLVKKYLKQPLIRLNERAVVSSCLINQISRQIWDVVINMDNIQQFIKELDDRRTLEKLGGGRASIFSAGSPNQDTMAKNVSSQMDMMIKKLKNLGLNEEVEEQLLSFKFAFSKWDQSKKRDVRVTKIGSKVRLRELDGVKPRIFDLEDGVHKLSSRSVGQMVFVGQDINMSEDDDLHLDLHDRDAVGGSKVHLIEALDHKRNRYMEQKKVTSRTLSRKSRDKNDANAIPVQRGTVLHNSAKTMNAMANAMISTRADSPTYAKRPELRLQANLHEHSKAVLKLAAHPHKEVFASCSADNTVKLWSSQQFHMQSTPAIVSTDTLDNANGINSLHFMREANSYLITGSSNCELSVYDTNQLRLLRCSVLDKEQEGQIVEVYGTDNLAFALTHHSSVHCFDLRCHKNVRDKISLESLYSKKARNSCGLITGFTVDPNFGHWMLLTTSSATTCNIVLWDLRFGGLEVASWSHPSQSATPFRSWSYVSSTDTTAYCSQIITNSAKDGELSIWELGTKDRTDVLWPSQKQPFSYSTDLCTTAVVSCPQLNGIFTGDSEGSLRYWNLGGHCSASNYLCGPYRKLVDNWVPPPNEKSVDRKLPSRFEYSYIDMPNMNPRVQIENRVPGAYAESEFLSSTQVSECHRDAITDLVAVGSDQLVSAGHDGVIKVWKTVV
ncbi:unnamed protein product [Bursaphelenchus okinawaensis]|uniref:non-specific serine/threonine protein kinase n=1 Tax=Bursaphelenchus okinawaensis TaxID=465554 RepID=A0A811K6B6_9BILA|nr:unnamed protein product [Bursaphelenchus okinawaensis]CAG9092410.1 unnamed protein product [Bursaphelenchus okinawaensis]